MRHISAESSLWRSLSEVSSLRLSFTAAQAFVTWSTVINPGMALERTSHPEREAGARVVFGFGGRVGDAAAGEQRAAGKRPAACGVGRHHHFKLRVFRHRGRHPRAVMGGNARAAGLAGLLSPLGAAPWRFTTECSPPARRVK